MEEDLRDPKRTIQIGIRGAQNSEESWQASEDAGIRVMYMEEFSSLGIEATLDEVRGVVGQGPTYVSFEIDGLDPAFAPGHWKTRNRWLDAYPGPGTNTRTCRS